MANSTRRLVVTELRELTQGRGQYGDWTLYAVTATTPEGAPVVAELRSFQELPVGQPIDVQVERREDDRRGVSFTLKLPRGRGPGNAQLQEQLDAHDEMLRSLVGRVTRLEQGQGALSTAA